ncbi:MULTISPECIES: FAD/NAD(P)-binding protein [Parachlamydia]|jgi:uncharacterized NAD(P)/FAD-binding protein YdhS|uniref:FAD/NAD(P)-binding protein n=1 Tax=Parachlamydia TaxID=83551 RepID=UPI0024E1CA01|nr:FAD/NAD(P)-binding protein [Parachlamydia acanthamoebae]
MSTTSIAIAGGGISGLAVLANLIFQAQTPFNLFLFEPSHRLPKGVAFSTDCETHPLNVRANAMGALKEHPDDFWKWVEKRKETLQPLFPKTILHPDAFLPRKLYGLYLEDLYERVQAVAEEKKIKLTVILQKVLDASESNDQLLLQVAHENPVTVDALVLACGVPPSKKLSFETPQLLDHPRYISDPWNSSALDSMFLHSSKVLMIGAGLTMADTVASLVHQAFDGKMICVSPRGTSSQPHLTAPPAHPLPQVKTKELPLTARGLFRTVRKKIVSHSEWRDVIDSLRRCTQPLWAALPLPEKKQFLRHLFSLWNNHRHRMAVASFDMLEKLKKQEKLDMLAGRVTAIEIENAETLNVTVRTAEKSLQIPVNYVVKCTGPEYQIQKQPNPLIQNLHQKGMALWDTLGMGLALSPHGYIQGNVPGKIYALGALLLGEKLETTAVPEIRKEAFAIAQKLLHKFHLIN